jgi:hypothetical protein
MNKAVPALVILAACTAVYSAWSLAGALIVLAFMVHLVLDSLKPKGDRFGEGDDGNYYSEADDGVAYGSDHRINPTTGLLMVGGVDVGGNPYGTSNPRMFSKRDY